MRLVNQLESGTSSIVLMFCAFTLVRRSPHGGEEVQEQVRREVDFPRLDFRRVLGVGLPLLSAVVLQPRRSSCCAQTVIYAKLPHLSHCEKKERLWLNVA